MNLILALLCNALAIVQIRLLSIRDGTGRRIAANLVAALPIEWQELFGRPKNPLHDSRYSHTFEFLRLQLQGTTGNLPEADHLVYLMLADDRPYVGKTGNCRNTSQLSGISPRWSEHVRELHQHMAGTNVPGRQKAPLPYFEDPAGLQLP